MQKSEVIEALRQHGVALTAQEMMIYESAAHYSRISEDELRSLAPLPYDQFSRAIGHLLKMRLLWEFRLNRHTYYQATQ